ncbi:MAG: CPBP family intramembrane metalloprotease [Bacteroidaceae bacterium]|nr:CPBP family intramembrane metalloprotease [Bacteroidaceae bacterium]
MKKVLFTILLAALLWTVMLSPLTAPHINFWWMMTGSACVLSLFATLFYPEWRKKVHLTPADILLGIAIAVALWCVFWVGDKLSQLMFGFARPQVDSIYGLKDGESALLLSFLMLFLIGPAEEIFWRGYVQQSFTKKWGANIGFAVATAAYTLVHLASLNFMLIMAALVAGAAWGLLYRLFPERFAAIIISHALWDTAVFIWFPIM